MKLGASLYSRLERGSTWLSRTWALEIASAAFSLACLLALFVVLSVANGKEIMVWHGITLNTITSILATSSKLSALYVISSAISQTKWNLFHLGPRSVLDFESIDRASRGALGCLQLLWQTRRIAVIGAVAFVVAVAFDPFAQQLVQYRGGEAYNNNDNVTLPVARRYDAGTSVTNWFAFIDRNSSLEGRIYQADFRIQAAVLGGLTQSSQALVQQLPLNCPSGNCTWEPRASLAVCSKCNDLATSIELSLDVAEVPLFLLLGAGGTGVMRTNSTRMTLPNGLWISNLDNYEAGTPKVRMVASGTGDRGKTNSMQEVDTLIWSMAMLNADPDPRNASAAWPKTPVQASECALYYCVKVYNTSITNNTATQLAQELATNRAPDSWQPISVAVNEIAADQTTIDSLEQGGLQGAINHTDLMIGSNFNVSQRAVMSTSQYFQSTFARNLSDEESSSHRSVDGNPMTGYYLDDDTEEGAHDPSIMQPLFQGRTDLPQLFDNIAASMTNAIRTSDQGVEQHLGKLGRQVTKYRVQWPWIALPAAIVLASLVQLLITILSSRKRPLWKSSTLATLSRGPYVAEVFDGATTIVELTDAAAKHDVDLFSREEKSRDEVSLLSTQDGQP